MLPAGPVVASVYRETIFPNAASGTLLIDCSTIDVATARTLAGEAEAQGFEMLEAPVSGGVAGADAGTLAFMVGGSETGFSRAEPILDVMGAKVVHCGQGGAGQGVKICNNMMLAIQMVSVAEGFALAEKLGLDPQKLFDVSSAASGQCWSLTTYCPMPGIGPNTSADNGYAPGFAAGLMHKDLGLAMEAAQASGADVAFGRAAFDAYDAMVGAGEGGVDFSGIIRSKRGIA
jgi:3-hydroxyisobutyrate dehydrogenase